MTTNPDHGHAARQREPITAPIPPAAAEPDAQRQVPAAFRYDAEIKKLACCPPTEAQATELVGYRYAFPNIDNPNNYLPVALINPARHLSNGRRITECCTGYSLSVYDSIEALTRKAKKAVKSSPGYLKNLGDHFVALRITLSDGLCTKPDASGHFDFFERATYSGRQAVVDHQRLPL
jgi:hypothetical protein